MPDARCARSLVCAMGSELCTRVFTASSPESPGIPRAMVLRLIYIVLSPVIGFLATVACGTFPPT
jgi:hypothetical protein